jgi:Tol biopolymer transport system component
MLTWTSKKLPVQSDGEIQEATLSPDQRWLAYRDESGIKILAYPFNQQPVSISSNQIAWANFLFNSNSKLLAYTDDEGLKIFNLPEQTSTLLLTHMLDESDEYSYRFYYPRQWSPDSQWLWIGVGHYEGSTRLLAHILSQTFHKYTTCYADPAWLPTSRAFLTTVSTSDYLGCGWEAGVYRVETAGVNSISEKRIYQETEPVDMWLHLPYGLQVSPDGKMFSFVQPSAPYEDKPSRLILISLAGDESKVLDTREGDILTPIWSADDEKLFYAVQGENASQIISLSIDSGETVILGVVLKTANLLTTLADGDWLVVGTVVSYTLWESLYLVNTTSGAVVKIAKLDYETYFPPFLGVVSAR